MNESVVRRQKTISKEGLLLKHQGKNQFGLPSKGWIPSKGVELIFSVSCGAKELLPPAVLAMGMLPACPVISVQSGFNSY